MKPSRPVKRGSVGPAKRGLAPLAVESLRIEELAPGGRGVAHRSDGRVVFIDATCPGDLVEVEIDPSRSSATKSGARLLRIVEPGPSRVEPTCSSYSVCGGCDWMHVATAEQPALHAEIVRRLLAHARATSDEPQSGAALPAITVWPAPRALGYRTRARLHVSSGRRGTTLGYLAARSHELVAVPRCEVLDPRLAQTFALLHDLFDGSRGEGEVGIALGRSEKPVLDIRFDGDLPASFFGRLGELVDGPDGSLAGVRVMQPGALVPATFGDPRPVQHAADGAPLMLAPGGFGQPSDDGAALLSKVVLERARPEGKRVVELFAGSGTLTVALAPGAAAYVAVEIEPQASQAARENLAVRGITAKLVVADADAFEIPSRTDLVVLDPPRTGAKGAAEAIARSRVRDVVYVSCDPATLARDVRVLATAGYDVVSIDAVELFPQTSHVETIVALSRRRPAGGLA